MDALPRVLGHVGVPPIKCQGIKTKLVPFIFRSIHWTPNSDARWIEPFLGSAVVALNLAPHRAILGDTNPHIIRLYRGIASGEVTKPVVRDFLSREGRHLARHGADYYYEVRSRFNASGSSLDFLFLNRSCFNGVMRFNAKGMFNVPFCHKPERFSQSYVTKIANQVDWTARQMRGKDWEFRVADWHDTLAEAEPSDFVYLDPPYIGRHTDYFTSWSESDAIRLAYEARQSEAGYALSMWLQNRHRKNGHIESHWCGHEIRTWTHFYHVGPSEDLRNEMEEALVIKDGFATKLQDRSRNGMTEVSTAQQIGMPFPISDS